MRIVRAAHLGMCFGVRDAIALAVERADAGPLTILGDLVHNPTVLAALDAKGIAVAQEVEHVTTSTVMVTAHGTSERTLARTRASGSRSSKPRARSYTSPTRPSPASLARATTSSSSGN